jgi:hypothetical protein
MAWLQRGVVVLGIAVLAAAATGCEDTTPSADQRAAVESAVRGYLDALAAAYASLDTAPLEPWASPDEIQEVRRLVRGLSLTGDRIQATLRGVEFEEVELFRGVNATARLVEVWDVVRYQASSGVEKGRIADSIQYSLVQLRLVDGSWRVIGRSVVARETPVAEPAGGASG